MKGEKGGQQLNESNTIDEMSDESFGNQTLGQTILGTDESQQNVIFTDPTVSIERKVKAIDIGSKGKQLSPQMFCR